MESLLETEELVLNDWTPRTADLPLGDSLARRCQMGYIKTSFKSWSYPCDDF